MTKIDQSKLRKEIEAQDRRDSRKKGYNIHALRLMLDAAKDVKDEDSFADAFTPTRGNHRIARNLGLNLDVQRGRWVKKEVSEASSMAKQEVKGEDLVQLLVNALEEGKSARATELVNQLLRYKVSESLASKRKLIAERLFGVTEGVEELVKTSNEPQNREDPEKVANETGDSLSNSDLASSPADEQADEEITEAEAARKRREAAFQKTQKDKPWPLPSTGKTRQAGRSLAGTGRRIKQGRPRHGTELPRKRVETPKGVRYFQRGSKEERGEIARRLRGRLQKRREKKEG